MLNKIENYIESRPKLMLALTPILGGIFVMAFPAVVIGTAAYLAFKETKERINKTLQP